jgi:hypothetical protein
MLLLKKGECEMTSLGKATIKVSGKEIEIEVKVNNEGNLVLEGLGPNIYYEMYDNELVLTRV